MNRDELSAWLDSLVEQGRMREEERSRLLRGRDSFDEYREMIEGDFAGQFVGFVDDQRITASTMDELFARAKSVGRPVYFEPVPKPERGGPALPQAESTMAR